MIRLIPILIMVLMLAACDDEKKKKQAPQEEYPLPDSINTEGMALGLSAEEKSCLRNPESICEYGLYFVTLGLPMDEVKVPESLGDSRDTLFTQEGFQWRGKKVMIGARGSVMIEGDFVDEGDPGQKLAFSKVNRIRVESPEFSVESLRVGSTFADLKTRFPEQTFQAVFLPDYAIIDISFPESRIHYNVLDHDGSVGAAVGNTLSRVDPQQISEEAPIQSIVVSL